MTNTRNQAAMGILVVLVGVPVLVGLPFLIYWALNQTGIAVLSLFATSFTIIALGFMLKKTIPSNGNHAGAFFLSFVLWGLIAGIFFLSKSCGGKPSPDPIPDRPDPVTKKETPEEIEAFCLTYFDASGRYVPANRTFGPIDMNRMSIIANSLQRIEDQETKLRIFSRVFHKYLPGVDETQLEEVYLRWHRFVRSNSYKAFTAVNPSGFYPSHHLPD